MKKGRQSPAALSQKKRLRKIIYEND